MNIIDWLFNRRRVPPPEHPVSPDDIRARERLREEWEADYRRRQQRAYELERRATYLTRRLFAPADGNDKGRDHDGD